MQHIATVSGVNMDSAEGFVSPPFPVSLRSLISRSLQTSYSVSRNIVYTLYGTPHSPWRARL